MVEDGSTGLLMVGCGELTDAVEQKGRIDLESLTKVPIPSYMHVENRLDVYE